jgi:HAD superfamily hydrolase (TIGR01509 family)
MSSLGFERARERSGSGGRKTPLFDVHAADGSRLYSVVVGEPTTRACPKAVLFEFDNVLYDATAWQRWLSQALRRMQVPGDYDSFLARWEQTGQSDIRSGRRSFAEAFPGFLRECGLSAGQASEIEAASQPRRKRFLAEIRPLPHVRPTLDRLAEHGLTLGLLADSEFGVAEIEQQLKRLGLAACFSLVLSSVELGVTKADSDGYSAALKQLGLAAERVAFVGNHSDHLAAAARLGMSTIAFNYDDRATADIYLSRFDELARFLKHWPLGA